MNGSNITKFHVPTKVVRGLGAVEEIGNEALALGAKRSLIVTGKNIRKSGLVEKVEKPLKKRRVNLISF